MNKLDGIRKIVITALLIVGATVLAALGKLDGNAVAALVGLGGSFAVGNGAEHLGRGIAARGFASTSAALERARVEQQTPTNITTTAPAGRTNADLFAEHEAQQ